MLLHTELLTQGWNGSTFCAQSLTWALICLHLPGGDDLGLCMPVDATSPPCFRVAGPDDDPRAFVAVQYRYGNVLILTFSTVTC